MKKPAWKEALDEKLGSFEDNVLGWSGEKKDLALLAISAVALLASFVAAGSLPIDPAWIAIVLCGLPIVCGAVIALVTEFDIKADMLVSLALIASIITGEYIAAGIVAFIMQIGGFLEEHTVNRARAGIERLVSLSPTTARIVEGEIERVVSPEEVQQGDILRVLPGETVPADGVVTAGQASIDEAVMTGESMPVDKEVGAEVSSGTINLYGSFDMRATRVGEDSSIARMVRLVQSADADKAKIVRTADAWATWIVVIALSISIVCYLITGEITRSVTVLVVFCPCALVLATPTAIMAAIGNATKHGFLTREGDALERLAKATHIAFDKTGTLTHGIPHVVAHEAAEGPWSREQVFEAAASAEMRSEHPLGKAIAGDFEQARGHRAKVSESFELVVGRGVRAKTDFGETLVGNEALMEASGVKVAPELAERASVHADQGRSVSFVAIDGTVAGMVVLADTLREESAGAVAALKEHGVVPVLLTGDSERAARAIADQVGIEEVHDQCLPEDKLAFIEEVEAGGGRVCMVGDGVNDAPALRRSYVGLAMGGIGSDIAVDASDIALVDDGIGELGHLLALSRHTLTTIKVNLTLSMSINIIATLLAVTGLMGPVVGALVHNIGSVAVIINSSLLLRWSER